MVVKVTDLLNSLLYIKIFNIPFIIIWVIATGVFCMIQFKFTNFRLFKHGIQTLFNLKCNGNNNGVITHIQAFATVISGTVGLGTISGVAIAITIGGPSAVFWMIVTGILGMSIKFAEVVLAFNYRSENTTGGAFYYMEHGLAKIGFIKTGKSLAFIYVIMLLVAMILGDIPFQANQIAALSNNLFEYNASVIISLLVLIVILGGIKRIAFVATGLGPIMIMLYVGMCVYLICANGSNLLNALSIMFQDIFNKSAIGGGVLSGLIAGVRRSVFANEAGTGTAAIAHSIVKEKDPVKVGSVAMIAPFVDTILVSFLTGVVIIITGMHSTNEIGDITLVSSAFSTVLPLFSKLVLPLIMFSFAFSTIIAYYYYCEVALVYLFGNKKVLILFQFFIVGSVYISCISKNIEFISCLGDSLFMCLMIPNAVAIYLLRRDVSNAVDSYYERYKHDL
ncbi:sodium/alanine symporter family protein [Wolbachia endosymbiont of Armadillidium vulgare str. wVulC]|uniref:alanine/glycine:cation symporter family protein n=1 Tax=Wolbachia endosymbiont of Armadillidium vulgare TaxID=77039 RepID=UPI00064A2E6F|nr:amino acid carrier protein [Wolbachia endosymbiont of Armadillidium vulgare]KLT22081.1 sodium/alanine symporter family protein [Wolbachia endosymbiont of Armadillidium vulgare str. wVulC]